MKKAFLLVAAVGLFVALGLSSCKSTEDCPAYSKTNIEMSTENV